MPTAQPTSRGKDMIYAVGLLIVTAVVFFPAAQWVATQAFAREQLKQSFLIIVLAGAWIAWEKRHALRVDLQLSNTTLVWFLVSYALAAGAILLKTPILVLAGLAAATAAAVNYVYGGQAFRRTFPLLAVFALFILCVLAFPILDWPLRQMAGIEAARFLKAVGLAPQLLVQSEPEVKLLLVTGQQRFLVATECNGFGLISSSLLLGIILLLYRRAPMWKYLLVAPFCVVIAFVFNFLRISAIVLLAPRFPHHYGTLHEIAGLVALYAGLALVWAMAGRRGANLPATSQP